MAGFTKLFSSILDSTIWQEPHETRLLWITMLAMCDARGEVQASIPGLARRAGITIEECEAGLAILSGPDRYSRTKDHEGRRIAEIAGGWRLLNHGRYRELLSAEERREYNRKKQAEWRAARQTAATDPVNDMSMTVNHNKQCQHISEADTRVQKEEEDKKHALALQSETVQRPKTNDQRGGSERAPIDFPDFEDIHPAETAGSMLALAEKVRSLKPEWKKMALTYAEMRSLTECAAALEALDDSDWKIIGDYMRAKLPEGSAGWQPRSRAKFLETAPDVYSHATQWASKHRPASTQPRTGGWK